MAGLVGLLTAWGHPSLLVCYWSLGPCLEQWRSEGPTRYSRQQTAAVNIHVESMDCHQDHADSEILRKKIKELKVIKHKWKIHKEWKNVTLPRISWISPFVCIYNKLTWNMCRYNSENLCLIRVRSELKYSYSLYSSFLRFWMAFTSSAKWRIWSSFRLRQFWAATCHKKTKWAKHTQSK